MASSVSSVYLYVIDDVLSKVREEFVNSGAGESVLNELQAIWETKMMQWGAISPNMERPMLPKQPGPITPVHDLNVPAVEEYETPTAEMLFPPTPLQTPIPQTPIPQTPVQTPLHGTDQIYNFPTGSDYAPNNDARNGHLTTARPSPYMHPPPPWMNQRPLGVDVNVAYVEGRDEVDKGPLHEPTTQYFFMMSSGKRKRDDYAPHLTSGGYVPQQDGSGDMTMEFFLSKESQLPSTRLGNKTTIGMQSEKESMKVSLLPQQDGVNDDYDLFHFQGVAHEDYNTSTPAEHLNLRAPTPSVSTPNPNKYDDVEDDEPPLNEDDDDEEDLDDFDRGEEEPNTQHLILAQFDKVTRTKSRWKCTLKDGIMHINSKDILFNKANGEFDF